MVVEEVLGIGGASAAKLVGLAFRPPMTLPRQSRMMQGRLMPVKDGRTVYRLRRSSCMPSELAEPMRKGIAVSHSSGNPMMPGWRFARRWPATPPRSGKDANH